MPGINGEFIYSDIDNFKEKYNKETEYMYLTGTVNNLFRITFAMPINNRHKEPMIDIFFIPGIEYNFIVFKDKNKKLEIDFISNNTCCYRITNLFSPNSTKINHILSTIKFKDLHGNHVDIYKILEIETERDRRIKSLTSAIEIVQKEIDNYLKEYDNIISDSNGELKASLIAGKDENDNDISIETGNLVEARSISKKYIEKVEQLNKLMTELDSLLSEEDDNGGC